ncbi:MAG TPA: aminotransferase class IV [Nonomuraea sp.]|nr:aminotransferase class IV [Nonomuraea sp.]
METLSVFTFTGDGGLVARDPVDDELLAADSWLVVAGRVRFLADHGHRFRTACGSAASAVRAVRAGAAASASAVPADLVGAMWRAVLDRLPRDGAWFPRVELSASGELRLRLRTAPARGGPLTVWVRPPGDPRRFPHVKGPDLPVLSRLRAEAGRHGAQEALLTSPGGWVVEGATTSLLWWEGDTLCGPPPDLPALPGVTTARLRRRAAELGIPVARRYRRPEDLAGHETWLVNALHGIRPVRHWAGAGSRPGPARRAASWQEWLTGQAMPLPVSPRK